MSDKVKKNLEEWMLEKGFTQRSLAREAGVSHSIINLVLDGTRANIRSDTRGKIAKALGIEIRQIIEFDRMIEDQLGKETRLTLLSNQAGYNKTAAMSQIAAVLP